MTDAKNPSLLDVFVIGSDAHHQLEKFLEITKILPNQSELLKLTDNMELRELNNANQPVINGNGPYNMGQQPIMDCPQSPTGQMNIGQSHLYRGQQHQPPHRYVNNSKMSKHRELPVDVPDSFVGVAKQSPRYPPPKPHRQVSPPMPVNNLTTFSHVTPQPIPYNSNLPALPSVAQSTAANIMTHNSSLRNSVKLKQLEKTRSDQQRNNYPTNQMQPAINQAFELNEDDDGSTPMNGTNHQARTVANHSQQAQKPSKQPMPDLCSIYNRLQRNLNGEFADVTRDAKLAKLLSIYNTIIDTHDKQFKIPLLSSRLNSGPIDAQGNQEPLIFKVSDLLYSVIQILRQDDMTNEVAELLSILCKHEIDGVCSAFDRITQLFEFAKSSRPPSPKQVIPSENGIQPPTMFVSHHRPLDGINQNNGHQMDDFEYIHDHVQMDIENNLYHNSMNLMTDIDLSGGICTKTVRIDKSSHQALGATIKNDEGSDRVVIGRIVCGGAAHRSGLLNEGDEILEVNGIPMRGKKVDDVVDIIDNMEGTLTFTLVSPCYNKPMQHKLSETLFVRAFFDFDADKDEFIPCRELGLSFKKGEILAIIDNSDPLWLQAHREGDSEHRLAGIIPSLEQLKQRSSIHDDIPSYHKLKHERKNIVSKLFNCPKGSSPKRKRPNMPFGPENPFYEEVYLYYPDNYRKRPIILVGPKMIGQREIVAKLLQDPNRFACAISHTSRPMQGHERNGVDFHFVTRAQFEADIKNDKFIECGQYQNQYYGTSIEAMKEVVKSKKVGNQRPDNGIYIL